MPPVSRIISLGGSTYSTTITINTITTNINVYSRVVSAGWNSVSPVIATVNINADVYSTVAATAAIVASGFPVGSKISINIAATKYVVGAGGLGGGITGGPTVGSVGGPAIYTRNTTIITNLGTIGGGGGGGGAGSSNYYVDAYNNLYTGGGGGGGGASYGSGGAGTYYAGWTGGNFGAAGTLTAAGVGGVASSAIIYSYLYEGDPDPVYVDTIYSGTGGVGGALGTAGSTGTGGTYSTEFGLAAGGAAGAAIDGSSYTTLVTAGTITGTQIN